MKKQMKLRNMILITTTLIATTLLLGLGYTLGRQFEKMLTERMVADYQDTVKTMQKNVETLILYAEDFTKYTSLDEKIPEAIVEYQKADGGNEILDRMALKRKWDAVSNHLIYSTSMLYSLEIYSKDTMVYSYYEDPVTSDAKNIPDAVLEEALSQNAPIWTDLLTLKQYRSYAKKPIYGLAVVKSVRDESMQRNGAIAVYVRESSFSDILESVNKNQDSRFYLVSNDNLILSAVDKENLGCEVKNTLQLTEEEYERCVQDGIFLKERRGQDSLLYVCRDIDDGRMKLVCEAVMEELGRQQKDARIFIGGAMLLAVGLAVLSSWFVSKRITKPLGELMGIMEQIKEDEKSIHLRYPEGEAGEVGMLGRRFNELMDELDMSMQRIYEEQRQRRHNEVRLLQAQIVPHFLYNTLGIISSFIKLGMPDKALETIQNLVSFYRLSLSSGKDVITLAEEVELTHNYMELQKLRYIEYMEYAITCEETAKGIWLPKLTLQPLMENILHHGLKQNREKTQIRVNITREESVGKIKISVYDNGTGMKPERLVQIRNSLRTGESITKSFGILNIDQRLKLMYSENYHMEIESVEGEYTRFDLYLPQESVYEVKGDV